MHDPKKVRRVSDLTLGQYEQAERDLTMRETRTALRVHAVVTVLVSVFLVLINVFVASEFPWVIFPVVGMAIGLYFHWLGYRRADADVRRRQGQIEDLARSYTSW
jgi:hypothetical protein